MAPLDEKTTESETSPGENLAKCIMSQYGATFLGVSGSTAYAVVKKPPKAMSIMILAGTAGATVDILYGWYVACRSEVELYNQHQDYLHEQKLLESMRKNGEKKRD